MTIVPGGGAPLHAIITERAGFETFYMSGSLTSAWVIGWPDVGATTMRETADNIHRIAKCVNIPVFADCDAGYGTAVNVYRTIKEYIWAGAAGCHLEDQESPKKSGSMAGRRIVSVEEAVGKYRAAMAAKRELDPDFVLCARTDARGAEGGGTLEAAIERARAYRKEAEVDAIFFEGLQSWDECKTALKSVDCPAFCLLHEVIYKDRDGNWIPGPSLKEQEEAGQKIALYPSWFVQPANQAAWETLADFKQRGVQALHEWRLSVQAKPKEMVLPSDLLSIKRVRDLEEKYLPETLQRDYDHTLGRRAGDPGT
jgi:2-methylisocitrate lyase-like PEP mutase family enzyme